MGTWEKLGKVNCGNTDIAPALCPGVMGFSLTTDLRANEKEISTKATQSYSICPRFTLISKDNADTKYCTHTLHVLDGQLLVGSVLDGYNDDLVFSLSWSRLG